MHRFSLVLLLVLGAPIAGRATLPPLDGDGPYPADASFDVSLNLARQNLKVDLFAPRGAPAGPLIVGAHGLNGKKDEIRGWGAHFATHGFAVAIPQFSGTDGNAAPGNADYEIALLDWMAAQNATTGNFFSGKTDGTRRAIFGHSMGGLVTHLAAAKDSRIQVALALDGVDVNNQAANAVPQMQAFPVELRASIQSVCNAAAPAELAVIAAFPGPSLVLTVANTLHCDPQDPEMGTCEALCAALPGPPWVASANHDAIKVFRRYATAAMRYFLLCDADARTNLDGAAQQADLSAGLITNYTARNMPGPSGCAVAVPDAGTESDAGIDAGEPIVEDAGNVEQDAGPEIVRDAGEETDAGAIPVDAGTSATTDAGDDLDGDTAKVGGCQCSATDLSPTVFLGLALLRRRRRNRG